MVFFVAFFRAAFVVFSQEHFEEDLHRVLALGALNCSTAIAQNCSSQPDGHPAFCQI